MILSALLLFQHRAWSSPILFLSTQLTPLPEATRMRDVILKDFAQSVDFEPDDRAIFNQKVMELAAGQGGSVILGGLQEDFLHLYQAGVLATVDPVSERLSDRTFMPGIAARRKLGTDTNYFVPWMQATYLMVASKRALQFLPKGADLTRLSYDELLEWAVSMRRATGKGRLGFPAGPSGLMVRFLQGYLYPSFTGSMSDGFSGAPAVGMWQYLRELWRYVDSSSLILNSMDNALLNGEVWVAWDHTARLLHAFKEKPDDFVAFAGPVGPKGRGFISVLAGLGVPRGFSSISSESLIEYLTRPLVQVNMMESIGFLPVVEVAQGAASKGLTSLLRAVAEQSGSPDAIMSSVPIRAASAARTFDFAYLVAFSRIVLRNRDIQEVLARQETFLRADETSSLHGSSP